MFTVLWFVGFTREHADEDDTLFQRNEAFPVFAFGDRDGFQFQVSEPSFEVWEDFYHRFCQSSAIILVWDNNTYSHTIVVSRVQVQAEPF